ncbi:hypothetical protein LTS10_012671 [Elasticomyces elasticus]|nr:hypothetical protein LTS10_012671 [Elasticomyces elasticus]
MAPKQETQKTAATKSATKKPLDPSQKSTLDSFFKLPNSKPKPGTNSLRPRILPDGYTITDAAQFKEWTGQDIPLSLSGSGLSGSQAIGEALDTGSYTTDQLEEDEDKENFPGRKRKKTANSDDDNAELAPPKVMQSKKKGKQRAVLDPDNVDIANGAEMGGFEGSISEEEENDAEEDDVANTAAMEEGRANWFRTMEETLDAGLLDEEVAEVQQKTATMDAGPEATPPLSLDELLAFCPTKKAGAFLRQLHARRSTAQPKQQPVVAYVDEATSRKFAGEAKYLDFKTDQTELSSAYPELEVREMVHPVGSFADSDIIAVAHYPTYTTTRSIHDQSIADMTNPCIGWVNDYSSDLGAGDIYLFDYCPVRLRRRDRKDPVVRRCFAPVGIDILDQSFLRKWTKSKATIGIVFGEDNAERYKRLVNRVVDGSKKLPICLSQQKMYGEEVHAYLEMDAAGDPYRITFLIYHPESHIITITSTIVKRLSAEIYRICVSVMFPTRQVKALRRTHIRQAGLWLAQMRDSQPPTLDQMAGTLSVGFTEERTAIGLFDHVFTKLMIPEAQLGLQLTEDDVPAALRPHLAFKLPFELDHSLNCIDLPFGCCALVAYLIARFDRQGIELPKHLRDLPPNILAILRGPLLRPAQSILMPVLLFSLSQLGEVTHRSFIAELNHTWMIIVWDEIKILYQDQPELFMTRNTFPLRPLLGRASLWPNMRLHVFREVSAYRIDETDDTAVVELVKKLYKHIRDSFYQRKVSDVRKGTAVKRQGRLPEAHSWQHGGTLGEAFNAMEVLNLMASPNEKVGKSGRKKDKQAFKSRTYIENRSSSSRIDIGQHDPALVARFDDWLRVATGAGGWNGLASFLVGKLLRGQIAEVPEMFRRYIPKHLRAVPKKPMTEVADSDEEELV